MGKLNVLQMVDLSWNQIRGSIPSIIGTFQSLNRLDLSNNIFVGHIPQSFSDLKGLEYLDLSYNRLSGTIPKSLEKLRYLNYLNFSFNKLSGEIPSGGPFVNFTDQSFLENGVLCGRSNFGVPPCKAHSKRKSNMAFHWLKYILPAIASTTILLGLILLWKQYHKRKASLPSSYEKSPLTEHKMVSYQELRLATNDFCGSNLIGVGSFGSVYKGLLSDGTVVAIKVLNLQMEGASKSFDAECKVLRTIRHRNLVKVITTCSSPEVRALVLQYMSNGSLEKWLYSHNYCLSILQRVSMLIDIASALEYLHHGQEETVVHCDVKPGNVLLDEDMVAHVADFGLAKILAKNKDATQTRTIGTVGYAAPEYGSTGTVSRSGDVYSFGIMLLEIMARKKPTDEMFAGGVTLRQWVNVSIPDNVLEVVDADLLSIEEGRDMYATESMLMSILEIGLRCSEVAAEDRMDIKDVVPKLKKIKLALQE
ncbi:probable LRR receptor-like serine/threonine-protein kinase At3g47570 [Rosa chinensis]|uniref:probable LRR receptor-like serine/threonine-protein kinase At3g47570 n=1 Tax=Rosa chinensis TaxID=74649 RepID=UPI000D094359|nr:probable LRR receptor-like serine/threonine-protein kinase At3g47570 [Rosa chinensis]